MIADVTHDLNEQISQLMQCKPLSEQQVSSISIQFFRSTSFPIYYAQFLFISFTF